MLREALLDLARLLVGVDMEREGLALGVAADLLQPVGGARPHRVRGDADPGTRLAEALHLREVLRDRALTKSRQPAARVGDVEEHDLDPDRGAGLDRRASLRNAEVVELADRGVARRAQLAVRLLVRDAHEVGGLPLGLREHRLAPGPEVAARGATAKRALERVAVSVDEAGQRECGGHGGRR